MTLTMHGCDRGYVCHKVSDCKRVSGCDSLVVCDTGSGSVVVTVALCVTRAVVQWL